MSEEPGGVGCPNFLTGAGGVLSAVWAGWGGVRLRDDRLDLVYPIPPPGATSMRLARLHCENLCNAPTTPPSSFHKAILLAHHVCLIVAADLQMVCRPRTIASD